MSSCTRPSRSSTRSETEGLASGARPWKSCASDSENLRGRSLMAEVPDNVGEVARALAPLGLLDDVVFVGGATVPMLLSDPAALPPRVTADVDIVVDVVGRARFYDIEARLREAGHAPDPTGPICRWGVAGVPVDLMPTDPAILGFSNRWYPTLVRTARRHRIAPDV